jgi:hypothetical protein
MVRIVRLVAPMILVLTLAIGLAAVACVREAGSVSAPRINQVYPLCIVVTSGVVMGTAAGSSLSFAYLISIMQ